LAGSPLEAPLLPAPPIEELVAMRDELRLHGRLPQDSAVVLLAIEQQTRNLVELATYLDDLFGPGH
jgi:hypothetical protein